MTELTGQIRSALAAHGTPHKPGVGDRMGFFSVPFRPSAGPLQGKILKPYRSGRDIEVLEPLVRRHATYLECLERAGLDVPRTDLILLNEHSVLRPVVVQEAVQEVTLLCHNLVATDTASALRALEQVALAICGFWSGVAQRPERIGLHASAHNFALGEAGRVVFLDTFPPLIGYSRDEMGRLLSRFSESGLIRGVGAVLPGRIREIQDPWYTLPGNLGLVIEGAMRLRPKDRTAIQAWAESYATTTLSADDCATLFEVLARPRPRLAPRRAIRFGIGLRPHA